MKEDNTDNNQEKLYPLLSELPSGIILDEDFIPVAYGKSASQIIKAREEPFWHTLPETGLQYFNLYWYYPTGVDFPVIHEDWEIRNLIWNFKASDNEYYKPEDITGLHKMAVMKLVPQIKLVTDNFFGEDTRNLTLVCVPASTAIVTQRRYNDFSEELCNITGMSNGLDHLRILKDGKTKNKVYEQKGKSVACEVEFEEGYFSGRKVLLFDDVISTGKSIEAFAEKIRNEGAEIVGVITIGKTEHSRQNGHPIEILEALTIN